jgi:hypothetical protein
LVLDVVVSPGKEHSAAKARPGLMGVLDKLTPEQRPALVRGDCGFGNEPFIAELEERAQPYLFKLRQTAGVKKLLTRQFARDDWSTPGPSEQGWSAVEDTLKLSGWDKSRRVVILRRAVKADLALSRKTKNEPGEQIELLMPDKDVQAWEYAVLVTNSAYALDAFGQLYRDRADCENGFDELKNQWGWGGFTTQDIERCQTSARAVALVYNWWSWYCRAAKPGARMEAITSRALLLAGVGRAVKHAGQTTLYLTPMHAAKDKLNLSTPFNFVSTADIIGGNSGSPVVNKNLELVGLIFDGNIQSLTGDFVYSDTQSRSVSVHSSAIRDALRYVYGADALADQLGK